MADRAHSFKGFLFSFIAIIILLPCALAGLALIHSDYLPPPQLSSSASFNAKARWLRGSLADNQCDVLVLGSSMALNNFSHQTFSEHLSGKVVNLGSWGLNVDDDYHILKNTISVCKPRVVIMPLYYGDFNDVDKHVRWADFQEYINGRNPIFTYLKAIDATAIAKEAWHSYRHPLVGRNVYQSLEFDDSGTVNLAYENFHVEESRWEGFRFNAIKAASRKSLDALQQVLLLAKENNFFVLIASVPLRTAAMEFFGSTTLDRFSEPISDIVTASSNGTFIRIESANDFPDAFFSDYTHLNERGAARYTQCLLDRAPDFVAKRLSQSRKMATRM